MDAQERRIRRELFAMSRAYPISPKEEKILAEIAEQLIALPRAGGIPVSGREPCERQVYVDQEVAERAAKWLNDRGIPVVIERCKTCGFLHLVNG